ncbi:uncharacterized protein METZ01_LOCUS158771, partial [marine metagenome]
MSNIKGLLKETRYHDVCDILKTAGQLGQNEAIEVHAVGGFVRDLLMERDINDIDIVAVGKGIPFAEKLANELGIKKIVPFKKFGTAIIPNSPIQIEVATARTESYDDNSRQPTEVVYTDLKRDLLRRDFTINAMAMDIRPDTFGELLDPF